MARQQRVYANEAGYFRQAYKPVRLPETVNETRFP